jgi:hypothetical protein
VNEFLEECRREWRRLGVPDPVASEMAADLTADLEEAEAEGGSPEDVLGNAAFDPRRFAASWAVARGVTNPPVPPVPAVADRRTFWRPPVSVALIALLGLVVLGAGFVLAVGRSSSSIAIASRQIVDGRGPLRLLLPGPPRRIIPVGPFFGTQVAGVSVHPLALLLLIVAVVGIGVLALLYWSPWSGPRRLRRDQGRGTANWN